MSLFRQSLLGLAAATGVFATQAQPAAPVPAVISPAPTYAIPPLPPKLQSPIEYFRQLLMMSPGDRTRSLATNTAESRAVILKKVREYQALAPDERELRLRATELRWYLTPLLHMQPGERPPHLAQIPDELRELVESRLTQWDSLAPPLKREFLANDRTLNYVAHVRSQDPSAADRRQQKIADQFEQLLSLKPEEEKKLLSSLSDVERSQMEKTLDTFGQLPAQQRVLCIRNYEKFANMTPAERAEFLKNAESWSKMSPQERQTWRDLVANVPMWPPLPTFNAPLPPMPPQAGPKSPKGSMVTN